MSQLHHYLVAVILLVESGIAVDVPYVFDEKSSDLAGYESYQLREASALSRDLVGIQPVTSPTPDDDYVIEVTLAANKSIDLFSSDNSTTDSQRILSGFVPFNQLSLASATNFSSKGFDTNLTPVYPLVVLPVVTSTNKKDYWFNEGNKNYNNSNYQEAIECYDLAIKLKPQFKEAWCNKGVALCRLCKYRDAIDAFDQAIIISPDYSNAWRNKGRALRAMGQDDEAKQAFQKAG